MDVGGNGGGEQGGAEISCLQAVAQLGGGDIFVDGVEQKDSGALD